MRLSCLRAANHQVKISIRNLVWVWSGFCRLPTTYMFHILPVWYGNCCSAVHCFALHCTALHLHCFPLHYIIWQTRLPAVSLECVLALACNELHSVDILLTSTIQVTIDHHRPASEAAQQHQGSQQLPQVSKALLLEGMAGLAAAALIHVQAVDSPM